MLNQGFTITAFDPVAQKNTRAILGDKINYAESPYQALSKADALVIITEWNEFKHADLIKVKKLLKQPVIFDGRNIYNPQILKKLGFRYYSVGRNSTV